MPQLLLCCAQWICNSTKERLRCCRSRDTSALLSYSDSRLSKVIGMRSLPKIQIRGLGKVYDETPSNRTTVFDDIDLSIGDGEFVSLVGPSGCGKSTLLLCIGGLE